MGNEPKRELWDHRYGERDGSRRYDFRYDFDPKATRLVEVEFTLALKMVKQILAEVGKATVRQIYYVGSRRSWWEKDKSEKRNSYKRVLAGSPRCEPRATSTTTRF